MRKFKYYIQELRKRLIDAMDYTHNTEVGDYLELLYDLLQKEDMFTSDKHFNTVRKEAENYLIYLYSNFDFIEEKKSIIHTIKRMESK